MPDAADLLATLRQRGHRVEFRPRDDVSFRLVVTPAERLSADDRDALKEHKEALLDLLWSELEPGPVPGWPHDSPNWDGTGYRWKPMTTTDGFTPESEELYEQQMG